MTAQTEQVEIVERMPRGQVKSKWKGERAELLTSLTAQGLGQTAIARRFAETYNEVCTRNMIIGAMIRLGLKCAAQIHVPGRKCEPVARPPRSGGGAVNKIKYMRVQGNSRASHPVEIAEPEVIDDDIPMLQRCTLLELDDGKCRWPVGSGSGLFFCGSKTVTRSPYCGTHTRRGTDSKAWSGWKR